MNTVQCKTDWPFGRNTSGHSALLVMAAQEGRLAKGNKNEKKAYWIASSFQIANMMEKGKEEEKIRKDCNHMEKRIIEKEDETPIHFLHSWVAPEASTSLSLVVQQQQQPLLSSLHNAPIHSLFQDKTTLNCGIFRNNNK
ncbi:hypothetical protein E2C01_001990 [Portunus trituberculatus]|uniref:Uncharacterized protein n=1 Tax=Portunus trituberculatus TaxID=210409 RepID=A0A5B7CJN7_PORTR|nr:hypothetical protein [Portunus trituberculatus]